MSDQSTVPPLTGSPSQMRTLAVRITDDLRAQLDLIAQLNDRSVTEEIRLALEDWIERNKSDPLQLAQAEYDAQHDARSGLPPPPRAPVEAPVHPRAPDSAPSGGVAGQAATPGQPAAPGSTGGDP